MQKGTSYGTETRPGPSSARVLVRRAAAESVGQRHQRRRRRGAPRPVIQLKGTGAGAGRRTAVWEAAASQSVDATQASLVTASSGLETNKRSEGCNGGGGSDQEGCAKRETNESPAPSIPYASSACGAMDDAMMMRCLRKKEAGNRPRPSPLMLRGACLIAGKRAAPALFPSSKFPGSSQAGRSGRQARSFQFRVGGT